MYLRPAYEFPHTMPGRRPIPAARNTARARTTSRRASVSTGPGVISSPADLDAYAWPDPANDDYYKPLNEAAEVPCPGMGLVSGVGGIFTRTWMLLGFEQFCFALAEQPELVAEIFQRVGSIQCEVLRRVVKQDRVVAVWYGDDLAYTESTMVSPAGVPEISLSLDGGAGGHRPRSGPAVHFPLRRQALGRHPRPDRRGRQRFASDRAEGDGYQSRSRPGTATSWR